MAGKNTGMVRRHAIRAVVALALTLGLVAQVLSASALSVSAHNSKWAPVAARYSIAATWSSAGSAGNAATPTPPPWTNYPFWQRIATMTVPTEESYLVEQLCGTWEPALYRTDPTHSYDQAICAARAVSGVWQGNAALDRTTWSTIAGHLGWAAALPIGNPEIWVAKLDISTASGTVVILDTETGKPVLIVDLAPIDG